MSAHAGLSEREVRTLEVVPSRPVNLRRDIYKFVEYVRSSGFRRTHRENAIPKAAARKLARLLSYGDETALVEESGCGYWSDYISHVARRMGLVAFNTKGIYQGYSSTSPSFPENDVLVHDKAWKAYLAKTARQKEGLILDALMEGTPNEFFYHGTLVKVEVFSSWGSALGPASKMKLPHIRRKLLEMIAGLRPDVWFEMRVLVELLRSARPSLILDPATRDPDSKTAEALREWEDEVRWGHKRKKPAKPEITLEDIYVNFREHSREEEEWKRYAHDTGKRINSRTRGAFHKVEGRYLEWFLREIPYIAGFVDLAYRPANDPHGRNVIPEFERLRAFRLTPWFFMLMKDDSAIEQVKTTVLPNFEVLVEAPSYPETTLAELSSCCVQLSEDGPVNKLRLDRKTAVETVASRKAVRPAAQVLAALSDLPLPQNVQSELDAWAGHAEKLVLFDDELGLIEIRDEPSESSRVIAELGKLVVDGRADGFVIVRDPHKVFQLLEERHRVPIRVAHPEAHFVSAGIFENEQAPVVPATASTKEPPLRASLEREDLVGYRCPEQSLLVALQKMLKKDAETCLLAGGDGDEMLILSAAAIPKLRAALRRLAGRYRIEMKG